jgi:hypothetical protein
MDPILPGQEIARGHMLEPPDARLPLDEDQENKSLGRRIFGVDFDRATAM